MIEQIWTFVGHWEDYRIVVEYVLDGEVQDDREDDGTWEQGLWAAAGSGATVEEAQAAAIAEYEDEDDGCQGHESLAGEHTGESVYCDGSCRTVRR